MAVEQIIESYSGNYLTMLLLSKDHSSTQKVIFIIYVHITHIIPCIWSSILFLIFFVHFIMIGWCSPQVLNQSKYHWTIIALTKKKVRDKGYPVTCGALLDPWGVLLAFCCWINLSRVCWIMSRRFVRSSTFLSDSRRASISIWSLVDVYFLAAGISKSAGLGPKPHKLDME